MLEKLDGDDARTERLRSRFLGILDGFEVAMAVKLKDLEREHDTVISVLEQVLQTVNNPQADDYERISFAQLKLSFLLAWLKKEPQQEYVDRTDMNLKRKVEELDISVRAYNALTNGGIHTVEELLKRTSRDLMRLKNMGKVSVGEINTALAGYGFFIRET